MAFTDPREIQERMRAVGLPHTDQDVDDLEMLLDYDLYDLETREELEVALEDIYGPAILQVLEDYLDEMFPLTDDERIQREEDEEREREERWREQQRLWRDR